MLVWLCDGGYFRSLEQAIQNVGLANFNGQAYFDAAINYKRTSSLWTGCPQWGFSQTKRYLVDDVHIFEFSAQAQDLVRITDWLPIVKEEGVARLTPKLNSV